MAVRRKRPLRVLTNKRWLGEYQVFDCQLSVELLPQAGAGFYASLRPLSLWRFDAVFLDGENVWLLVLATVKKFLPFIRSRLIISDIILNRFSGPFGYLKRLAWRWLLKEVDCLILYFRDTKELQRTFAIPSEKIRYVAFKPNTLDRLLKTAVSDEGYFLSAGRSNRDLRTLFESFETLPYLCNVLAPWEDLEEHGTSVIGCRQPPNISLISDDGSGDSWNAWIARSRAVILPIEPGKLSPSGIGTYLVAMALGKCVIITESPATRQILTDDMAVIVPPKNAEALRTAIVRVAEDRSFRESVAESGRRYALSLGGEARLRADLVSELSRLFE